MSANHVLNCKLISLLEYAQHFYGLYYTGEKTDCTKSYCNTSVVHKHKANCTTICFCSGVRSCHPFLERTNLRFPLNLPAGVKRDEEDPEYVLHGVSEL